MTNAVKIAALLAAVIVIGVGIGLMATRRPPSQLPSQALSANTEIQHSVSSDSTTKGEPKPTNPLPSGQQNTSGITNLPAPGQANTITNWEEKLDDILGAPVEESAKAKQILEVFAQLPEAGQTEAVQHLANLTEDTAYAPLAALMLNPALPEEALEALMADLLNRPNSVKLPLFLEIARAEKHPNSNEAMEMLELFLEENHGKDWDRWQTQIQQWLKDNPD